MTDASGFVVLPAIDLRGGRVVRLQQGDFARETAYSDDPVEVATRFADAGARWLHVVDLDGARTGTPENRAAVGAIVQAVGTRVQVEVAGGLREASTVAALLEAGVARAVVGTAALQDPSFAGRLVTTHGAGRIVAAIDVRDGRAVGHGWVHGSHGIDAAAAIERLSAEGISTFEVTATDRDGLLGGPDLDLYDRLMAIGPGSIIASGGVRSVADLRALRARGCEGAIVGRAFYEGRISISEALALRR
jgi:phosphoribosylformimino-5-aminoimidazole carboxamide ribotide isomerase